MDNIDTALIRRAYHEAGCALALYRICFNLAIGDGTVSPKEDVSTLLRLCRNFSGLSLNGERTKHWNNVAYTWRASDLIFLGGYAAVRIKLQITDMPSLADPDFESAYYAQQWFYVDLDRNPTEEQVWRDALDGLSRALEKLQNHWLAVETLATHLLERHVLSPQETFETITAHIDVEKLALERLIDRSGRKPSLEFRFPMPKLDVAISTTRSNQEFIEETDLEFSLFRCCEDQDLSPFKCPVCSQIMVFCYECDTLFPDLRNTGIMQLHSFFCKCPKCQYEFEEDFVLNPLYHVSPREWRSARYDVLLTEMGKKKLSNA